MRWTLRSIVGSALVLVSIILFFGRTHDWGHLAISILGIVPLVGVVYFLAWAKLKEFLDVTGSVRRLTSGTESLQGQLDVASEAVGKYKDLLAMPRPRPVRLTHSAKETLQGTYIAVGVLGIVMALVILISLPILMAGDPSATRQAHTALFIAGGIVLSMAALTGFKFRGKALVVNGEIAIAKVIDQQLSGGSARTSAQAVVRYEFNDAYGTRHSRSVFDNTNSLYEGMTVPVFYDSKRPASQIAGCEAMFEVAL